MQRFSDNKAGMAGIDKERIQKIIEENTSPNFEEHAKKQAERINEKIVRFQKMIRSFSSFQLANAEAEADRIVDSLEDSRDLSRNAVHIDMDAFYAAVEMRDSPALRTIPMAVGSDSMLSTSNYAARRFGVRAAMPGFIARRLCPDLKIVRCNFAKYIRVSRQVKDILREYDPNFQMGSLDEAYLDITDFMAARSSPESHERVRYMGDCICRLPAMSDADEENMEGLTTAEEDCPKCGKKRIAVKDIVKFGVSVEEVVSELRFRVEQATGLTCSAGIAPNSMIAKICSDMNKPNGQFVIENDKETLLAFMRTLPIRKVCGIGPVTEKILQGLDITCCGDLYEKRALLCLLFTPGTTEHFLRVALGISTSYTAFFSSKRERRKSISNETTFHPTGDLQALLEITGRLCGELAESLADHSIRGGRAVTLKMKFSNFDLITRCTSVDYVVTDATSMLTICEKVLKNELRDTGRQLRLLGVCLSRLIFSDNSSTSGKTLKSYFELSTDAGIKKDDASPKEDGGTVKEGVEDDEIVWEPNEDEAIEQSLVGTSESDVVPLCPVCQKELPEDIVDVNRHIDECLNKQAIRELQEADLSGPSTSKTAPDVCSPTSAKRRVQSSDAGSSKRRKSTRKESLPRKTSSSPTKTLLGYFGKKSA